MLLRMPPDRQYQIEAHEIHDGRGLDCTPVTSRIIEHHAGDWTIWLLFTPVLRENTLVVVRGFCEHP
ncbi:hypothetical protein TNCV_393141 [Trichonephila clavipes]|nr:hypothetical protein TNCV_393141 [Trichonephila clavipes]